MGEGRHLLLSDPILALVDVSDVHVENLAGHSNHDGLLVGSEGERLYVIREIVFDEEGGAGRGLLGGVCEGLGTQIRVSLSMHLYNIY